MIDTDKYIIPIYSALHIKNAVSSIVNILAQYQSINF